MIMDNNFQIPETPPEIKMNVTMTYPRSDIYEYTSKMEVIDLDKEAQDDLSSGNGFLISSPKNSNKKDMKDPNGIYSSRFGQKIGDQNPFADRYSCECGHLKSRIHHGLECPVCHTKVKYVDDNFKLFGWIILKDQYHIIHPKFYSILDFIFGESPYSTEKKKAKGRKLQNILNYAPEVDQHGFSSESEFKPDNEPYYGIGMTEFYNRFDEILEYYISKYPKKESYYNDIIEHRNLVFCHSIPVFTTHLRPTDIIDGFLFFEPINGMYNMINRLAHAINKDKRKMDNNPKIKNSELFALQMKYMELCDEVKKILSGKHGTIRNLVSGRFNFSTRAVIRQDATLRVDQVKLPYVELVKTLQQRIINILVRSYNISPNEAYDIWYRSISKKDDRVAEIIDSIIHANPEGLPVLINRNPTLLCSSCYCI